MTDPTLERAGVVCPCGTRAFWVEDTRVCAEGIARRRVCKVCGRHLLTVERIEAVTDEGMWGKFTVIRGPRPSRAKGSTGRATK